MRYYKSKDQYCSKCKTMKGPFLKHTFNKRCGKQYYRCRPCNTEEARKYRKTENGKLRIYSAVYKSMSKFKHKQAARHIVNEKIRKGEIVRPSKCSRCGKEKFVYAHHNDYEKPLEVIWLCRGCHADIHKLWKLSK